MLEQTLQAARRVVAFHLQSIGRASSPRRRHPPAAEGPPAIGAPAAPDGAPITDPPPVAAQGRSASAT